MRTLTYSLLFLFPLLAFASDYEVGDGVACGQREGTVLKVFSRESLVVRFQNSFWNGVVRDEDSVEAVSGAKCFRRLGASVPAGPELVRGSITLCGSKEGEVLATYTWDVVKIRFYASYENGPRAEIDETYLVDARACERQLSPATGE